MSAEIAMIENLPPAPIHEGPSGWLRIIDKMVDKGVPMEQLQKLLDMQQQFEREQARKAYVVAVAAFKADAPTLTKNKRVNIESKRADVEKFGYSHITLAEACRVLIPALAEHGLSHAWETDQADAGVIKVTCRLSHIAGHSETVTLKSVPDQSGAKNAIQAVGSTVSYLQRYTFMSLVGMAAEEMDDDGRGTSTTATITGEQIAELNGLMDECEKAGHAVDLKRFLGWMEVDSLDKMPQAKFAKAVHELKRKKGSNGVAPGTKLCQWLADESAKGSQEKLWAKGWLQAAVIAEAAKSCDKDWAKWTENECRAVEAFAKQTIEDKRAAKAASKS